MVVNLIIHYHFSIETMKRYSLLFLFLSVAGFSYCQIRRDLTEKIYKFSFSKTKDNIEILQKNNLNKNELLLIKTNYYWWQYLSGNAEKQYLELCLKNCHNLEQPEIINNSQIVFQYATIYCFIIRIYAVRKQYLKAISFLDKAMPYFEYAMQNENKHDGLMLISGLYNYLIDNSLNENPFFYPYLLIYPGGDKFHGLDLLHKCTKSDNVIVQTEAYYFLMKIYFEIEKKYGKAQLYAEKLLSKYPKNLVYRYEYCKILAVSQQYNKIVMQKKLIIDDINKNTQLNQYQKTHFLNLCKKMTKKFNY